MGEKIRDIKEIKLGNEVLMIEENEGYSAGQGRVIHVQNKDFRYLLTEKAFLRLLVTIMRAKEEKDYYKSTFPRVRGGESQSRFEEKTAETTRVLQLFCEAMEKQKIRYRFVECGARFVTFLVNSEDYAAWQRAMKDMRDIRKQKHVFGKSMGYEFLYQMRPFELYQCMNVFVEFYFQLPCMSLTPKTWIPLDRHVQRRVWEQEAILDGVPVLDSVCYLIYRVCWPVFFRGFFSDHDKAVLESCGEALSDPSLPNLLSGVFFKFAPRVLELLKQKKYDAILPEYYAFDQY